MARDKVATYEDVLNAPAHFRAELIMGELHLHPRPARRHALAASSLGMSLGSAFDLGSNGPGGWVIVVEPELHLDSDVLVPDLAGWREENFPRSDEDDPYFSVAPDWACEVLSPRTAKFDRTDKLTIYARSGVSFAWLVDPQLRTLEVFRLADGKWVLDSTHADSAMVTAVPFDAVELPLGTLWRRQMGGREE
jgi:Uma2 family endonuclease